MITDKELTPEEGLRRLHELLGSKEPSKPQRKYRRYVLETESGAPVFRLLDCDSHTPRSENELWFEQFLAEEFGDDIVPRKLAKLFPGSGDMVRS
jgi:hypothetical protein